jgi:hypothetical protein
MRMRNRLGIFAAACLTAAAAVGIAAPAAFAAPENANFAGMSADGSRVFFDTSERMVPADTDKSVDVYERSGGKTILISQGQGGPANGPFNARFVGASADGSVVFFETSQSLSGADTDANHRDIYVRAGGHTVLVSGGGNGPFGASFKGATADGSHVFFQTADRLASTDTDGSVDVYEATAGGVTEVSVGQSPGTGNGPFDAHFRGASVDGSQVFFSTAEPLMGQDADTSVDVYRRQGSTTSELSRGPSGGDGPFAAHFKGSSSDGGAVFFTTSEGLVPQDSDGERDIYVRSGGSTDRVSVGRKSNTAHGADFDGNSADGSQVFFSTHARMEATDTDLATDIYRRSGVGTPQATTSEVSVAQPPLHGNHELNANFTGSTADGSHVFFETKDKLASTDGDGGHVDVYDRAGGATSQISTGGDAPFDAHFAGALPGGGAVFFETGEQLSGADRDGATDVYVHGGGATALISQGAINGNRDVPARFKGAAVDGSSVLFTTDEPLVRGDADTARDVYRRSGGGTAIVSVDVVPPQTKITKGPKKRTHHHHHHNNKVTFKYKSTDPGSTFKCKVDGGGFKKCKAKGFTTKLRPGKHLFEVAATDSFGNKDKTPAKRKFKLGR